MIAPNISLSPPNSFLQLHDSRFSACIGKPAGDK